MKKPVSSSSPLRTISSSRLSTVGGGGGKQVQPPPPPPPPPPFDGVDGESKDADHRDWP